MNMGWNIGGFSTLQALPMTIRPPGRDRELCQESATGKNGITTFKWEVGFQSGVRLFRRAQIKISLSSSVTLNQLMCR